MNRGWDELKKDPKNVKTVQIKSVTQEKPPNAWSSKKTNSTLKILQRDSSEAAASAKVKPNLEDKALWPSLGPSSTVRSSQATVFSRASSSVLEPNRTPSVKVLSQPVHLKPDSSINRSYNDTNKGDTKSWTSVAGQKARPSKEYQPPTSNPDPKHSTLRTTSQNPECWKIKARPSENEASQKGTDEAQESWTVVTNRKEKAAAAEIPEEIEQNQTPEPVKKELTEEEKGALREIRRERRLREKESKRKRKEEEKRRKIYEPKSVKIQFIHQDLLQKVLDNKAGVNAKKILVAQNSASGSKSLKFMDDEYPCLDQKKPTPKKSVSKYSSVDSGSDWETEEELESSRTIIEDEQGKNEVKSESVVFEMSKTRADVRSILKGKRHESELENLEKKLSSTEEKRTKSFADILASKVVQGTVNLLPKQRPSTSSAAAPAAVTVAPVPEVKKVKRKDPITFDIFDVIKAKRTTDTNVKQKPGHILGSKVTKNRMSANEKQGRTGNSLDSSGPTKRRGKERERPRLKKPNKFKRLLIQNRKEQQELRQYLTKVSEARLKQQLLNAESFSQVSQDVKGDNTKEVDLKIEPLEDVKEVKEIEIAACQIENIEVSPELHQSLPPSVPSQDKNNKSKQSKKKKGPKQTAVDQQVKPEPVDPVSQVDLELDADRLMKQILEETPMQKAKNLIHSRKFRDYCDHVRNEEMDSVCFQMVEDLVRFQDRQYFKDPIKAKTKKRYVAGLREIKKYLIVKKISALLIAPDLESGLSDTINELKTLASLNDVPYFFVLGRHKLGKACRRKVGVSAIGIFNYQGSETNFHRMMELLQECKVAYDVILQRAFVDVGGNLTPEVPDLTQIRQEPEEKANDLSSKLLDILRKS